MICSLVPCTTDESSLRPLYAGAMASAASATDTKAAPAPAAASDSALPEVTSATLSSLQHLPAASAQRFEQSFVHNVYETIAPHFSSTRHTVSHVAIAYKGRSVATRSCALCTVQMWPKVKQFLQSLPAGSVVADVGCGNGKYMLPLAGTAAHKQHRDEPPEPDHKMQKSDPPTATTPAPTGDGSALPAPSLFMLGSDISESLIGICAQRGLEVMVCDSISLPYRSDMFVRFAPTHRPSAPLALTCCSLASGQDAAISIAVIHHFATPERRRHAIAEMCRILRVGGKALIYVWSFEEGVSSESDLGGRCRKLRPHIDLLILRVK
jgi:SAM-dependent methyltransferase